ncbi:MAG: thiamine-phosphate kinase, partial [Burkholderiales bacterium]|nr:thiamine-phosphate kinase [Burkholderiales bacterium]
MASEFELIERHFTRTARRARLGVGDDCALFAGPAGHETVVTTDLLASGTHFLADTDPRRLGHKALAVNLSDLAAMGATPRYFLLALALPEARTEWIEPFAAGMFALAERHGVELIGGDTTRGALTICITAIGEVPDGQAIRRDGAASGDDVWVSGTLGDAALGLLALRGEAMLDGAERAFCVGRLESPEPRVDLGLALRGVATSMVDLSDGLAGDLAHIARRSGLSARLNADALPFSFAVLGQGRERRLRCALAGGDDYELCFTAPVDARDLVIA